MGAERVMLHRGLFDSKQVAELRSERQLAAGDDRAVAGQDLFDERRSGARKADDEDRLGNVVPRRRSRMICRARRESDQCFRFFGDLYPLVPAAVSLGELSLASNPILPSLTVMPKAIVEPPALKKGGSREVVAVLEERQSPLRLIHSSKQYRALQVDVGALLSRDLPGDIELPFGRREVAQ